MNFFKQYYEKNRKPLDIIYNKIKNKKNKTVLNLFCFIKLDNVETKVLAKIKKNYLIIYNRNNLIFCDNLKFLKVRMIEKIDYIKLKIFHDDIICIYMDKNSEFLKFFGIISKYCIFDLFSLKFNLCNVIKKNENLCIYNGISKEKEEKYLIEEKYSLIFLTNFDDLIKEIKIKRKIKNENIFNLVEINQSNDFIYLIYKNDEHFKLLKKLYAYDLSFNNILNFLKQFLNIILYFLKNNITIIDFDIDDFYYTYKYNKFIIKYKPSLILIDKNNTNFKYEYKNINDIKMNNNIFYLGKLDKLKEKIFKINNKNNIESNYLRLYKNNNFINLGNFLNNFIFNHSYNIDENGILILEDKFFSENFSIKEIILTFYIKREFIDYEFIKNSIIEITNILSE